MNRAGYNDFGYGHYRGAERIEKEISWGAKYLIVNRKDLLEEEYLQPYLKSKLGGTEHVSIFRLVE